MHASLKANMCIRPTEDDNRLKSFIKANKASKLGNLLTSNLPSASFSTLNDFRSDSKGCCSVSSRDVTSFKGDAKDLCQLLLQNSEARM